MSRRPRATLSLVLTGVTLGAGCLPTDEPARAQTDQALGGIEGTFEYALDAPWRMEPVIVKDRFVSYDPIPIQIAIHDANRASDEHSLFGTTAIGHVCSLAITQGTAQTHVGLASFAEVERTIGPWTFPSQPGGPPRETCVASGTSTCAHLGYAGNTSEWHGLVFFRPTGAVPGADIRLQLTLLVTRSPTIACGSLDPAKTYRLTNYVQVHYGEAPLPRFSSEWVYGDLHYHSQGTDNEGESAYAYRNVTRAMQAIGLDFLWATEHASASEQLMDVDISISGDTLEARARKGVLRDTDANRFRVLQAIAAQTNLDSAGRNAGVNRTPQIFVGGEVDAMPEMTDRRSEIAYGARQSYPVGRLCGGWRTNLDLCTNSCASGVLRCCEANALDHHGCDPAGLFAPVAGVTPNTTDYLIQDVQGLNEPLPGREHMVYLPDPDAGSPFVGSFTGTYGGARRRLTARGVIDGVETPGLLTDIRDLRGSVFLAHHNNAPEGGPAPQGPPWTHSMLHQAWSSPAVLGFEFWNENPRRQSPVQTGASSDPTIGQETGYERNSTAYGEDLELVDAACRVLRVGSDGLAALRPFDVATGRYHAATTTVEQMLTDGAASLDEWNLVGLEPRETATLDWLPAGMPRRVLLAAGSDAHGDLNYRREGYMTGTTAITDTALGSPRNLVFAGPPQTRLSRLTPAVHGPREVLAALRAGHFAATDGPALRVAFDLDGDGVIGPTDPLMGDVVDLQRLRTVPILVEWATTPEFGELDRIELTVGVWSPEADFDRTAVYTGGDGFLGPAASVIPTHDVDGYRYRYDTRGYWHLSRVGTGPVPLDSDPLVRRYGGAPLRGTDRFLVELDRYHAVNITVGEPRILRGTRFFIRVTAFTRPRASDCADPASPSHGLGRCIRRYALGNPIWIRDLTDASAGGGGGVVN